MTLFQVGWWSFRAGLVDTDVRTVTNSRLIPGIHWVGVFSNATVPARWSREYKDIMTTSSNMADHVKILSNEALARTS
jgi:hypothetical protein